MQDSDVVAAIVAGDPDGLAEAYQRYAAPLYAYCRLVLPEPDAAGAVQDTFVVATSRLEALRDPARLGPWLQAVAGNECLRRGAAPPGPQHTVPEVPLPDGLREQVLAACTDSTPAGRAYRVRVGYRAGAFGRTGFPKPPGLPAWAMPRLWHGVRRHPRAALAVALAAVTAAGVVPALALTGSHRAQAAVFALGGGVPPGAGPAASTAPASRPRSRQARTAKRHLARSASQGRGAAPPTRPAAGGPAASATAQAQPPPPTQPAPAGSATPPPPAQGYLEAAPAELILVPAKGKALGTFVLTAVGGPVGNFSITVPPGLADRVTVTPSAGSLPSGGQVLVTVTVAGKAALEAGLTVNPGTITVTVLLASDHWSRDLAGAVSGRRRSRSAPGRWQAGAPRWCPRR
jgi:hypothetical protein